MSECKECGKPLIAYAKKDGEFCSYDCQHKWQLAVTMCNNKIESGLHKKGICCHVLYCVGSTFLQGKIDEGRATRTAFCYVCDKKAILGIIRWRDD